MLALATMACALLPATAGAATLHATTSTFASTIAAAQPGDTVMLASGSYGAWKGVTKTSPGVTITREAGATPSMSLAWDTLGSPAWLILDGITVTGGQVSGPTHDVTVKNSTFPGYLQINPGASPGANNACGNCPAMNDNHIVFDNDLFNLSSCPTGSCLGYEGRISFAYQGPNPAGVTVKNSTFSSGCADGVQFVGSAGRGVTIGPGNVFTNLLQGSCAPHVDSIQFVGGNGATITGNYFSNITTGIASYDGGTTNVTVTDNVFASSEVAYPILFGGDNGAVIEHNTLAAGKHINLTSKAGASSRNETIRNNITPGGVTLSNGVGGNATPSVNDYNVCSSSCAGSNSMTGTTSYVGPSSAYDGWALTASSIGQNNASDGSDRGIRVSGSPPPPPPDTTAPDTTIGSGPANPTTSTSATFAFSSNEAGTFECKLDAGAYASCSSPKAYSALSTGSHTFSVRATDAAGNVDASAATQTWTISAVADTTAPDTTITSGPANPTTETTSSSGFTSSETGSTFACKLDAGAYASCSSPKANSGLSMGSHTFSVRATDAAGNTDATPASQTWMIQSTPPADSQPVAAYVYSPTAPAAGQAVLFDASSATCADVPCTYSWADDGPDGAGGTQWPLGSGKTLSFTFQGTGVKNVRLAVTDADGDTNSTMKAITVAAAPPADTTPPSTTIDSGPTNITTNDNTPTFTFSSSEASTFQCKVDSGAWAGCTSPWTTSTLSDGAHNVSVRATDTAGNVDATPSTRSFTVSTAPATPQNLLGSTTVQSVPDSNTPGSAEAFSATASGSGSAVSLSIYVGSGNSASTMVAGIYTDANGHPGTLLTKGTRSSLTAAGWNTVTVPAATITSGSKYWIALLGTGGTLTFRDGAGSSSCRSEGSRSGSLTTLPTTWQTGASYASCPLSGYATS